MSYALASDYYQNRISRLKKALVNLKKAMKFDRNNYKTLTLIGSVYILLGNHSKASEYFVESLEIKKDEPLTIALISIAKTMKGDMKIAYKI